MSITVVGRWARVWMSWCGQTGDPDDVWLLRLGETWRIARLERGTPWQPVTP